MVKNGTLLGNYMSSRGKNCCGSLLRGSVVPAKFLLVLLNTLPAIFGEAIWYNLPKTADLTELDDRWHCDLAGEVGQKR